MTEKKRILRFNDDRPVWALPDENEIRCKDCPNYIDEREE